MGESRILTLDSEEIVYGEHTTRGVRLAAAVLNAEKCFLFSIASRLSCPTATHIPMS